MAIPLKISIIIPTLNEAKKLPGLLSLLQSMESNENDLEIIISDGNSQDDTVKIAKENKAKVAVSTIAQRAIQLNSGASIASGDILYFLHADCLPPSNFPDLVKQEVKNGFHLGCFRLKFDHPHWFLKTNAWFTRFHFTAFHFGDQSLFITRNLFDQIGGYDENLFLNEDQEIIARARKKGKFIVMSEYIITSARKYLDNGVFRLQFIFYIIYFLYQIGIAPLTLRKLYKKWIV